MNDCPKCGLKGGAWVTHVCGLVGQQVSTVDKTDPLMTHTFSGDPWGICTRCHHPIWHAIHRGGHGV